MTFLERQIVQGRRSIDDVRRLARWTKRHPRTAWRLVRWSGRHPRRVWRLLRRKKRHLRST
jgi:hypothetical protein